MAKTVYEGEKGLDDHAQKKCWELLAQTFDRLKTLRNSSQ